MDWTNLRIPSTFKRQGDEHAGPCVFHPGSKDTFVVNPARETFICHKCGSLSGEVLETHARALHIWTESTGKKDGGRWANTWTWSTADGRTRTQGRLSPEAAANFGRKKEWKGHNRETCDRKTKKTGDEKKDAKLPCTCGLPEPLELLYVKQPGLLTTPSPIILTEGASSADHVLRREIKVGAVGHFAGKTCPASLARFPKGTTFHVWPDADAPGAVQAVKVADVVTAAGFEVDVLDPVVLFAHLPEAPKNADAGDWTPKSDDPLAEVLAAAVDLETFRERLPAPDAAPATSGSGFPAGVDAALDALTSGGLGAVAARLEELVNAVSAAALTGTSLIAVQAAAIARLKSNLQMGVPEARAIVMKAIQDCGAVDDDTKQGTGLEWDEVEPAEVAVPLDRILDQLVEQLGRFLHLPDGAADVIATWIAWTYVEPLSPILPTLAISSPTKGCGKTLLLDVISVFVERPFDSATVTPAAIFRTIEAAHPTMLLDEADRWMKQDATGEKVAILNAGHRRGGSATRCVGEDYEPRRFRVDSPRAIAGIGDFLPDTLADRSITLTLERKPRTVRLESFRLDRRPAPELRGQLKRWSEDCGVEFAACDPNMGRMDNREADNWRQLFGVADQARGGWSARIRRAAEQVQGRAEKRTTKAAYPEMLLIDCRTIFDTRRLDRILSKDLDLALRGLDERPWDTMRSGKGLTSQARGRWLSSFGINSVKLEPEHLQGYERDQFSAAWESYALHPQIKPGEPGELGSVDSTHPGFPSSPGSRRGAPAIIQPEPAYVMKHRAIDLGDPEQVARLKADAFPTPAELDQVLDQDEQFMNELDRLRLDPDHYETLRDRLQPLIYDELPLDPEEWPMAAVWLACGVSLATIKGES